MYLFKFFNKSIKHIVKRQNYISYVPQRQYKDVAFDDIPDVSVTVIRNFFKKNEMKFTEAYTNFVIGCPVCEADGESLAEKTKIFINKRTGSFSCETCKHTGPWKDISTYITAKKNNKPVKRDPVIETELALLSDYVKLVKNNTKLISSYTPEEYKDMLLKFKLPDIAQHIISGLGIRLDVTDSNMYLPLLNSSSDIVGYKVINCKTNLSAIEPKLKNTFSTGVIISKSPRARDAAVVVANLSDFLVLANAGVPYTVICLPMGLSSLSQHILPCFDPYTKLILWFSNEITAFDTARTFSRKIGERRCLFVRSVDTVDLPHIEPNQNFKAIISSAQAIWHKSITTFSSLREDVLADLMNIERVQGVKWTRFPALNRTLKGHRRGELTVFTGPTGSGKTTFISEYSLDLAMQGVNTLWGSFEIRNARLARTMLQQMSGCLLDQHLDQYDYWADKFEQLPMYYMTFHGQQTIKVVMEAIEHAVYVHDIAHVIIDNLQFMMGTSEDTKSMDRFWKQDIIVSHFRTFATRRNCHVTLVIHPRKEKTDEDLTMSSIFGGAKASQEADNILIIQDKRMVSVKGKKYLQIFKNRYCGDLGIMPLDFDKTSLSFAPKKKKDPEKKAEPENN